jgi:hypothetical protein
MGQSLGKPIPSKDLVFHVNHNNEKSHLDLGTATYFYGVSDYVSCGSASLDFDQNDAFTLSAWVNPNEIGIFKNIMGKDTGGAGGLNRGYFYAIDTTGQIQFQIRNSGGNRLRGFSTNTLNSHNWYHVCLSKSGSNALAGVNIWINGVSESLTSTTDNLSSTILNSSEFAVGNYTTIGAEFPFDGFMVNASVYNKELNSTEINQIYDKGRINPDYTDISNLVSHWKLDSLNPTDTTGSNNGTSLNMDGTSIREIGYLRNTFNRSITGSFVNGAGGTSGSFYFDGVDDYIEFASLSDFSFMQNTGIFTLSVWMKFDDYTVSGDMELMGNNAGGSVNKGFRFAYQGTNDRLRFILTKGVVSDSIIGSNSSDNIISDNNWHHIVVVGDGTNIFYYVDNVKETGGETMDATKSSGDSTYLLALGKTNGYGAGTDFNGNYNDVYLWDRNLSDSEVTQIFEAARRKYGV